MSDRLPTPEDEPKLPPCDGRKHWFTKDAAVCGCGMMNAVASRPLGEAEPATWEQTPQRQRLQDIALRLNDTTLNDEKVSVNQVREIERFLLSRRAPQDDAGAATADRRCMVLVRNPGDDWREHSAGTLLSHDEAKRLVDELQSDGFQREVRIVGVLVFTSTVAARRASGAEPTTGRSQQ